jgi:thiol-disulfide isomerase/thioredoxin
MKKIMILLAILTCGFTISSFAQNSKIEPLKIGDKLPDLFFNHVINYKESSVKLSDFKNKLLILDFWATWCHWCIEAFPKNDSLQKKFGDKLQIMLVNTKDTKDDEMKVAEFYKKRSIIDKDFKLPSIYMDTVLTYLFPRVTIPHYVWVKNGVIKGFSDSSPVTSANIEKMLRGEEVNFPKKD